MKGFDPGWLRHRVTIEEPTATPDLAGGESVLWSTRAVIWAEVAPVAAREAAVAGHHAAVATHEVTMRWRNDLDGRLRLVHRDRIFRILAVTDPDERRRYLVASVREEAP